MAIFGKLDDKSNEGEPLAPNLLSDAPHWGRATQGLSSDPMIKVSDSHRSSLGLRTPLAWIESFEAWLNGNLDQVRQREQALEMIASRGGQWLGGSQPGALPWTWRLFGAKPISYFFVSSEAFSEDDCERIRSLFPEACRVARLAVSVAAMNDQS
jgi:hypothetical protein